MTSEPGRTGRIPRWLKWTTFLLFVVTIFIGLPLLVMSWDDLHSWERRFPFPAPQPLTEEVAIDYSGRAFARTRIDMTDAKPAPFYRGRTNIFMFNSLNTNSGSLLWRVPSRGTERGEGPNFTARVSKVGEELVVTLSKHWL